MEDQSESSKTQGLDMLFYAAGNLPKPELNKTHLRLYNHNLCPYAARTRYALALKRVPFQDCQIDQQNKAPWHVEFNGGMVPVLETPQGDMIKESGVIMLFAHEAGGSSGAHLVPKDPVAAAMMRLKIEDFNKFLSNLWPIFFSRGQNSEAIDNFAEKGLPEMEKLCEDANGGWLSQDSTPSLLDVHCSPMFEFLYNWEHSAIGKVFERLDVQNKAPHMVAYVKRWREHPDIKPTRMSKLVNDRYWERTLSWPEGEIKPLQIEDVQGGLELEQE